MNNLSIFTKKLGFEKLKESRNEFVQLFTHGTLEIEFYKPIVIDKQQTHKKDELYIVATGKSMFSHEGNTTEVNEGDCLFVPAYDEHRFFNFTDDFATWVVFFGPDGGE